MISDRISDDISPQMKNLNIVIPILMYFLTINITINIEKIHCFSQNVSVTSDEKHDVNQSQATLLMTLGFRRYIAEYTVAMF